MKTLLPTGQRRFFLLRACACIGGKLRAYPFGVMDMNRRWAAVWTAAAILFRVLLPGGADALRAALLPPRTEDAAREACRVFAQTGEPAEAVAAFGSLFEQAP